ncbi:MAG TPA: S53 family peptidase [Acidimicrobiales bacterium]|nr:S53 family peptidase [Acidimicrobiales bacterium]
MTWSPIVWSDASATSSTTTPAWTTLLDRARDLGASGAKTADVLFQLRDDRSPGALIRWCKRTHLAITWVRGNSAGMVSGSAEALGRALGVSIDNYELAGFGRFYAAHARPLVPPSLRGEVQAFGRISSLGQVHPEVPVTVPIVGLGPGGFIDAYDARPLWARNDFGQGETIVFFEVDGYSPSDLATYAAHFGLPPFADPLPHIGALDLKPEGESTMDLEAAHAIAPGARLVYVNLNAFSGGSSSPTSQFAQAFATVAKRYPAAIWSISLGQCETLFSPTDLNVVNGVVDHAERAGTSVFVASGDSGGLECLGASEVDPSVSPAGISFPGDLPNVTSVGGTTLDVTTGGDYAGETTWTEPLLSQGSTGGQSSVFRQPRWQRAPGVISSYSSGALCGAPGGSYCREAPDVAADANPITGAAVRFMGRWLTQGGTSLASPEWAAFTALADNYLTSLGDKRLGFANPLLYRLAAGSPPYPPFHEVTLGANDLYPATSGYNMVTGLGSPDVWNLVRDLADLVGRS